MRTLVVTGGIATGKTTAVQLFRQLLPETVIFDADSEVHDLLTNPDIKLRLEAEFGDSIFTPGGDVDRSVLGKIVFSDAEKREILEKVLHPVVLNRCEESRIKAASTGDTPLFLADVPLYYESEFPFEADEVVVVAAARQTQLRRLRERGGLHADTAENMIALQMPLEEKIRQADRVIWNDGNLGVLKKQVYFAISQQIESNGD